MLAILLLVPHVVGVLVSGCSSTDVLSLSLVASLAVTTGLRMLARFSTSAICCGSLVWFLRILRICNPTAPMSPTCPGIVAIVGLGTVTKVLFCPQSPTGAATGAGATGGTAAGGT